jgi:hypothetical protein
MGLTAFAQQDTTTWKRFTLDTGTQETAKDYIPVTQYWTEHGIFQHMDVSLTAGTTGIGIDVASPVGKYVQLRAGYEFMPRFTKRMEFELTINGKPAKAYDKDGYRQATTFDKMNDLLYEFTGYDADDHADMIGKPTINNFKFLVDVFPFQQNKHWHFTAGFYWGPSRFAYAENATESMRTISAVGIYNNMYNKLHGKTKRELASVKLVDLSVLGPEYKDLYFDIDMLYALQQGFDAAGRMGVILGTYVNDVLDKDGNVIHKKGEYYMMTPDDDDMVKADMKVNAFKPYIGVGYEGRLVKGNDRLTVAVDGGIMLWGGKPSLITHDGTDLIHDVEGITGKVGSYVDVMSKLSVYPTLSVRFAYTIF